MLSDRQGQGGETAVRAEGDRDRRREGAVVLTDEDDNSV